MITLGPRLIDYIDATGRSGQISIVIKLTGPEHIDLGKGETTVDYYGQLDIECDLFNRTFKVIGRDELNTIMLLFWFSDIWLRRVCRENNIEIFRFVVGDMVDDFSVYKP